mmetsp:Transcript_92526/g.188334  ORF Transcript_92526/g.188334 Transcript_92526/m.188334 type:complete len:574 (-) Transcript_92526:1972-3693(-)
MPANNVSATPRPTRAVSSSGTSSVAIWLSSSLGPRIAAFGPPSESMLPRSRNSKEASPSPLPESLARTFDATTSACCIAAWAVRGVEGNRAGTISEQSPRAHTEGGDDDDDDDDDHYHHDNHHPLFHDHNRHHNANHPHRDINARPKLNGLNYLNVITLVLNVFTSYFIGVRGLFGVLTPRRDIFIKYETLVTPADYAYWLWAPILVFEFIFATAQLFPHYRARPIIQQGTGLYFFWACIIQTVWTLFFAMSWFILSFVAVVLALLCLVLLLASQHYNCLCAPTARGRDGMTLVGFLSSATVAPARQRRKSLLEYWFFRFPFYLHCGWLLVCMVVQFSMVFRYRFTHSSGAQLTADIVALGVLLPPATFFLTGQSSGPDFVIPIVIIWSYLSIAVELNQPSGTLVELYGHPAILAVQNASYIFAGIIGVMLVPRVVVWIAQEFCTIDVVELDDEANITTAIHEVRSGSGGGLFHRFSRRRADGGDDDAEETEPRMPLRDPLLVAENGDGSDDGLFSVRRRLIEEGGGECGEDPAVAGEEEGKDEERYEDCHETENANNREGPPTEAIETEDRA